MDSQKKEEEINSSLDNFLKTVNSEESESALAFLIEKQIEPLVKSILRGKFHVSLKIDDDRQTNQDALELTGEIKTLIILKLRHLKSNGNTSQIENFEAYVKTVTVNAYRQYLQAKYPVRLQLKNKLRYLLTHRAEFGLWESENNVWVCGFSRWQKQNFNSSIENRSISSKINLIESEDLRENFRQSPDIVYQVALIFNHIQNPILFADLVAIVCDLKEVKEFTEIPNTELVETEVPAKEMEAVSTLEQAAFLKLLWKHINDLPVRHRLVLLLNLKDQKGENLIAFLPQMRVATIRQIAETLEIPIMDFVRIWNELPWDDARIAEFMQITRQQVINLRQSARKALHRQLKILRGK